MENASAPTADNRALVVHIVGSYLQHHQIPADQLAVLIPEVHRILGGLGQERVPEQKPRKPAVAVSRSVQPDHVICLECGFRGQMLRGHLKGRHGLTPDAYRARWKLTASHPITAPLYSEQRSAMAKVMGLGREPNPATASPPAKQAIPKRRGRPRAST